MLNKTTTKKNPCFIPAYLGEFRCCGLILAHYSVYLLQKLQLHVRVLFEQHQHEEEADGERIRRRDHHLQHALHHVLSREFPMGLNAHMRTHTHTNPNKPQLWEPRWIHWSLTCANRSSAVKLILSSLSACSISLLFCSTSLSMASCSSWLWGQAHETHFKSSPWTKKADSCIKNHSNARSRCCLVPLMNPPKLEVNVWLD